MVSFNNLGHRVNADARCQQNHARHQQCQEAEECRFRNCHSKSAETPQQATTANGSLCSTKSMSAIPNGWRLARGLIDNGRETMKRIIALLFAAGLSLGIAQTPAAASSFDLGTLSTSGSSTGFVANFGSGIKTFSDTLYFSLANVSNTLVGQITDLSAIFGQVVDSLNFTLDLFSASDTATSLGNYTDPSGTGIAFSYADLAAGDYFFRIAGDSAPTGNAYNYAFNVKVTETPIPPALLLFGTALGGMGVAAYRKRKARGPAQG